MCVFTEINCNERRNCFPQPLQHNTRYGRNATLNESLIILAFHAKKSLLSKHETERFREAKNSDEWNTFLL